MWQSYACTGLPAWAGSGDFAASRHPMTTITTMATSNSSAPPASNSTVPISSASFPNVSPMPVTRTSQGRATAARSTTKSIAAAALAKVMPQLLAGGDEVACAAAAVAGEQRLAGASPVLATLVVDPQRHVEVRTAALSALAHFDDQALDAVVDGIQADAPAALQLELLDAAARHGDLQPRLAAHERALDAKDPLASWRVCMDGGDAQQGRHLFFDNEATRCTRCHTVGGSGGNAGPVLDGVGKRRSPDYLLQALVEPSAVICEGFASTVLQLHNGDTVAGLITKEQDGVVEVMDVDGNTQKVPQDRIRSRSGSTTSAMPKMAGTLDRRQLRDVIAFLRSLQQEPAK